MRRRIWLDFFAAAVAAIRRPNEQAITVERRRGVDKLGEEVVRREGRQQS